MLRQKLIDLLAVTFRDEFFMLYSMAGKTEADLNNRILFFRQEVMAPARLAGVHRLLAAFGWIWRF